MGARHERAEPTHRVRKRVHLSNRGRKRVHLSNLGKKEGASLLLSLERAVREVEEACSCALLLCEVQA
jgi:hypothetical protein